MSEDAPFQGLRRFVLVFGLSIFAREGMAEDL
jgi:hypothetical protein